MLSSLRPLAAVEPPHDAGVHQVAALSARSAFVFLCIGLCWGIFTSTGWLNRLTGRQATRNSHLVLITLALAFTAVHAAAFLYMENEQYTMASLLVPVMAGSMIQEVGTLSFELMLAIALSVLLQRFLRHRQWLWVHRLGYPAVTLGVLHSFAGAMADGHLATLWVAGIAILVPTGLLVTLRFVPARRLADAGLVRAAP